MTAVYVKILRRILHLCKFIGIINTSNVLQSDSLLIKSTHSVYKYLEISRMIIKIIPFIYNYTCPLSTFVLSHNVDKWHYRVRPKINITTNVFINSTDITENNLLEHIFLYLWPPKTIDFTTIAVYNIIRLELIVDVSVLLCSYFFLQQLEYRFQVLNNTWAHLLPRFHSNSGDCTHFITGMTRDKIRLLQAKLSDLLRIFSDGYRKVLLGYFMYWYCNMVLAQFLPFIFNVQNIILILPIVIAASRIH
ncbi:Gustatory receptor, partial [Aphis craccivora]